MDRSVAHVENLEGVQICAENVSNDVVRSKRVDILQIGEDGQNEADDSRKLRHEAHTETSEGRRDATVETAIQQRS